ncbi:MAG: hypothetical protein JJT94_13185 [Bernardetiaceae bacterium]|nr:hypothetical protein [Bernardetiaceae bacterium]
MLLPSLQIILALLFAAPLQAGLEINALHDWEGHIGNTRSVRLSMQIDQERNIEGEYFYVKYVTKIPLKGQITEVKTHNNRIAHGKIELVEYDKNKQINGYFVGEIRENRMIGTWRSADLQRSYPFELRHKASSYQKSIDKRYEFLGISTEEAENFAKKIQKAILQKDKQTLAQNIDYPLLINSAQGQVQIQNKQDWHKKGETIFTPSLLKNVRESYPIFMKTNAQGFALGKGYIWMNKNKDGQLKVIAINDF